MDRGKPSRVKLGRVQYFKLFTLRDRIQNSLVGNWLHWLWLVVPLAETIFRHRASIHCVHARTFLPTERSIYHKVLLLCVPQYTFDSVALLRTDQNESWDQPPVTECIVKRRPPFQTSRLIEVGHQSFRNVIN